MTTGSSDSSNVRGSTFATSVIQVTNIAPQATRDQMYTFFSFVGQVDDVRLYPSMRDASISITSRTCFVRFAEPASVTITLHLNNTVFIDRAIIITPVLGNKVPEENEGLVMAMQIQQQQQQGGIGGMASNGMLGGNRGSNNDARILAANPGLVSMHPTGKIATPDAALDEADLPPYPLLTGTTAVSKVEEIRRTITVAGLDSTVSAQQCMEFFAENAGEVKYFRYCTRDHDHVKYALIEFSERASVVSALNLNDRQLGTAIIKVIHSTESINKPQTKSNEAAAKEIEEAMSKVTEASHLVSAAVDPLMGMLTGSVVTAGVGAGLGSGRNSMARSRSRSRRRSRSRDRDYRSRHRSGSRSRRRSKSRDRGSRRDRHRSRSRSRDRKKSSRHRSRSKESKKERKRSRSKEKKRSRRSRSKEKERTEDKSSENGVDSKGGISDNNGDSNVHKKDVDHETGNNDEIRDESCLPGNNNGETEYEDKGGKRRSRTKSPSRKRSKSKDRGERRKRSRSKDRHSRRRSSRSKSRDRKKRSRSKEKSSSKKSSRHRSKSRDRERNERKRSRSKERNRDSRTNSSKDVRSMKERSPGHASDSRVVRDYDQEEAGFESNGDIKVQDHPYNGKSKDGKLSTLQEDTRGEAMGTEDMEISNSP